MVFTFVSGSRKPCTTSALVRRNVTGVPAGNVTQRGTNSYCWATRRTVTDPWGPAAVPRLLSTNSPRRCSVVGSMTSTLLGGCIAPAMPVATMTTNMMSSMAAIILIHRFSVRATTSAGTIPSGSGAANGFVGDSATRASRHEQEEIKGEPTDQQKPDRDAGDHQRAQRALPERLYLLGSLDRCAGLIR